MPRIAEFAGQQKYDGIMTQLKPLYIDGRIGMK
jgi:hypothetical protein